MHGVADDSVPTPAHAPAPEGAGVTRRSVIGTTAGLTGAAALAACGSSGGSGGATTSAPASSPATSPATTGGASSPAGAVLAKTGDVPVGGGVVVKDQKVVVVQATQGTYTALSAVCTHRGCVVQAPAGGVIACKCHGSEFGLDGSVKKGPAERPLAPVTVVASGGEIRKA